MVDTSQSAAAVLPKSQGRLVSLDVLRGLTVALMILVNNAGDGAVSYAQLRHSAWSGCTLTDVVFPMFLFIVGGSIALAFQARRERGVQRAELMLQVLKRSVLIFLVGLVLNALPYFHLVDLRIYGVLQRIAICYALASAIFLMGGVRVCAAAVLLLLVGYWWMMIHISVPGFGRPGVDLPILDRTGDMASWLDRKLVPAAHLYHHTDYDPEGLLSTLPALASTLLGLLAVTWLRSSNALWQRAYVLVVSGLLFVAGGLLWANAFPMNKRLWTSSFVLFTAGISMVMLAVLFWLIDGPMRMRRGLLPWLVFGTNALTAYVFSEVLSIVLGAVRVSKTKNLQQLAFNLLPHSIGSPSFVSMVYSVLFVVVCFVPVMVLYRRKIFIKL